MHVYMLLKKSILTWMRTFNFCFVCVVCVCVCVSFCIEDSIFISALFYFSISVAYSHIFFLMITWNAYIMFTALYTCVAQRGLESYFMLSEKKIQHFLTCLWLGKYQTVVVKIWIILSHFRKSYSNLTWS